MQQADVRNYTNLTCLAEREGLLSLIMKMEEQAAKEDEQRQEMPRDAAPAGLMVMRLLMNQHEFA